jgi:hypothetical protein
VFNESDGELKEMALFQPDVAVSVGVDSRKPVCIVPPLACTNSSVTEAPTGISDVAVNLNSNDADAPGIILVAVRIGLERSATAGFTKNVLVSATNNANTFNIRNVDMFVIVYFLTVDAEENQRDLQHCIVSEVACVCVSVSVCVCVCMCVLFI